MDRETALAFDLNAIDEAFIRDPYPTLRALREHSPVHFNGDGSVFLTRYADVRSVYQDRSMASDKTEVFGEKFGDRPLGVHHTTSLIFNDPPYHTVVRKLLASGFTPRKLAEMEPLIGDIVERLLDDFADCTSDGGSVDFVDVFAKRLPTEIISFMLGVPPAHREKLRDFSLAILGALDPVVSEERLDAGDAAVREFSALLNELIDHRRRNPEQSGQGEVLEALIFGEVDGRRLTQEELIQNCIFLLNAGHETTTSLVANATGILLDNPSEHRRLRDDPALIDSAVEEFLRVESPLQIGNRTATQDTVLSGVTVPAGTYIHTSIAAANRDPEQFDDPESVNLDRKPNRHIAFITGIHVCLGATLARLEGRIAIGRLVQRFPTLQSAGEAERMGLTRFRGWKRLPVQV